MSWGESRPQLPMITTDLSRPGLARHILDRGDFNFPALRPGIAILLDFLAHDRNVSWRFDANPDTTTGDPHDGDLYLITQQDTFPYFAT